MKIRLIPDVVKQKFRAILDPVIQFFIHYELNPNFFTTISLIICAISAYQFGKGSLRYGGLLLLLGGLFDMIDGDVARASNRVTRFGALYDSTLDRYAEILVFFGIGAHFIRRYSATSSTGLLISMVIFIALAGSLMVSYVRARAEGLGFECKVGIMQRPERIVLIGISALIAEIVLIIAMFIIAILANITALQRIYHIWSEENSAKWNKLSSDIDHE